jgi:hypothetical protein
MLRHAVLGLICLASGAALAQQAPPPDGAPAGAASSSPAPASPPKAVISMEEPLPGDHWTYEIRDEITGTISANRTNVVTEVTPKDISVRFKLEGTRNEEGFSVYDRSWNVIDSSPWKFSPNDGTGIRTPLTVGKTWTFQTNNINKTNGNVWKRLGVSKVASQETVVTKAGTFETFKIETTFSAQNVNVPALKNEVTSVTWYAPAVDHWVKRTFISRSEKHLRINNTLELTEYGRKQ